MDVGRVRMGVLEPSVTVRMGVRFAGRVGRCMRMAVVFVVDVRMGVRRRLMLVIVVVLLGQMQIHADRHQQAGHDQLQRDRLARTSTAAIAPRNGAVEK